MARAAIKLVPEDDLGARLALRRAWRAQRKAKRLALLALARDIFALHNDGHTAEEMAAMIRRNPRWIRAFAAKRGVTISRSTTVVRRAIQLSVSHETALRRLSEDLGGKNPAQALAEFVALALADDARAARRFLRLGRKAAP
jgi:hypothetical protein